MKGEDISIQPAESPDNKLIETMDMEKRIKRRKRLLANPILHYFLPFFALVGILAGHLYLSVQITLYAFVLLTTAGFVTCVIIGTYLYLSISPRIRRFYYGVLGWKCWAYNPLYYTLYLFGYRYMYNRYIARVRTEESYLFGTEGAFLSYAYKVFPLVILYHLLMIFLRWIILKIIPSVKNAVRRNRQSRKQLRVPTD